MTKKIAILQSNYIPWKGYFDIINLVDEFILYDDMQYTRRDWRNRNKIKTRDGLKWLTIPVQVKGKYYQKIRETEIEGVDWAEKHWKCIRAEYAQTPFFKEYATWLETLYTQAAEKRFLSEVNYLFLAEICKHLGMTTRISWSHDYVLQEGKSERLLDLTLQAGGTTYLSGPAAQGYLDESVFTAAGIAVEWMDYSGYTPYTQQYGEFEHGVSIIDLLLNMGNEAPLYMKSFST